MKKQPKIKYYILFLSVYLHFFFFLVILYAHVYAYAIPCKKKIFYISCQGPKGGSGRVWVPVTVRNSLTVSFFDGFFDDK